MRKKLAYRGRHTVLPIVGDTLVEVRLSTCRRPAVVFKASDDTESELILEDYSITLKRGDHERLLEDFKREVTFRPTQLAPLLELLDSVVTDAIAEQEGRLRITFANKLIFEIASNHGYEAWHFQCPRPGRPVGGDLNHPISLSGDGGSLI